MSHIPKFQPRAGATSFRQMQDGYKAAKVVERVLQFESEAAYFMSQDNEEGFDQFPEDGLVGQMDFSEERFGIRTYDIGMVRFNKKDDSIREYGFQGSGESNSFREVRPRSGIVGGRAGFEFRHEANGVSSTVLIDNNGRLIEFTEEALLQPENSSGLY